MNLPNKLTILRFILVPFFVVFMMLPEAVLPETLSRYIGAALFALTAITDMLDGRIARKYNLVTNFGKFMDPLADKFMIFSALVVFTAKYSRLRYLLVAVTIIVMLRELAVTSLRLIAANSVVIAASKLGKIKTVVQCATIIIVLLEPVLFGKVGFFAEYLPLSVLSLAGLAAVTVISGLDYFRKYKSFLSESERKES